MKKIIFLMMMSCCVLAASAKSGNPKKNKLIPFAKVSVPTLKQIYCTSGSVWVDGIWGPEKITCVKCSTVSMLDAQVQVSDCLMDIDFFN